MKNIMNKSKGLILKYAKICHDSPANFWQKAAILTISVYHLCQIAIIGINKDTPKREKAFLIPQEIVDGVINLATFVVFAEGFKRLGRNLVKKDIVKPFVKDKKVFSEEFATTTNLIGSLLAVNIVSPIIRNKIGGDVQKMFIKNQEKPEKDNPKIKTYKKDAAFKNFSGSLRI